MLDAVATAHEASVHTGKEFIWKVMLTCKDAALHLEARNQLFKLYTFAADDACLQDYVLQLVRYRQPAADSRRL